ncbi:MAG: GNAT family N-acetyltransferase [Alphaproteobacteria bacterium]|nr:GNAT family N-acetyltransferase [Alphaproteobacteria bacterium]
MLKAISRTDPIFKSDLMARDAIAFNVMLGIVNDTARYPNPRIFSNGKDCVMVNTSPDRQVIVWTADTFSDYEGLFDFLQKEFANNAPLAIISKTAFYDFLKSKGRAEPAQLQGVYKCDKLNDIAYVGKPDEAREDEAERIAELLRLFHKETGEAVSATNYPFTVWRDTNDTIVAIARNNLQAENHGRIGIVITAPEHRGKSYAKMLVHYMTGQIFAAGKRPLMFTDLSYEPSNRCYKAVGYELLDTIANYVIK